MSEWKSVTLGSVLDIKHGYAFPGEGDVVNLFLTTQLSRFFHSQ